MSKEAVFTMKLESELRAEFIAVAEAEHRPASQIVRELMRGYVSRKRQEQEYQDFITNFSCILSAIDTAMTRANSKRRISSTVFRTRSPALLDRNLRYTPDRALPRSPPCCGADFNKGGGN